MCCYVTADSEVACVLLGAAKSTVFNGGQAQGLAAGGGGGGGGGGAYYYSQQSASGGHLHADSYDSATLRATGTFSNRGIKPELLGLKSIFF